MAVLCSNCSGKLIFNPATQKLECANCGSFFSPEDVRDLNADLHSKYYDTRVYICGHCGAEVVTSDSEASTFCVYCGNPAIVFSRISKEYKPDGIIPFQVTKEDAIRYVKLRFLKNPMVPKEVKEKLTPGNIRGIYVPYWIINAAFSETDMLSGEVKNGKRTEKRWYARAGEVKLKNVPVDGSKILNDDISMNGFYSNTSDTSYNELRTSAAERCHKLYAGDVVKDIPAKNVKIEDSIYWVDIQDDPIYIMMPVWFFTFKYDGKPYTILINGQTGKVVGTMPWKQKSLYMITGGLTVLTLAVMSLLFVALKYNFFGLSTFYNHAIIGLMSFASFVLTRGITGIVRIFKNLKLTQSEDIFKYVKKRQE